MPGVVPHAECRMQRTCKSHSSSFFKAACVKPRANTRCKKARLTPHAFAGTRDLLFSAPACHCSALTSISKPSPAAVPHFEQESSLGILGQAPYDADK
eukprot:scaffold180069_cov19-Tisochrysis_lutea.AAC.1